MRLTRNKELNQVLTSAEEEGWTFVYGGKHIKGTHPTGKTTTISRTPSDGRAVKNIRQTLKVQ
jgi:hypothetical protein